jgi:hypothetical protein
VLVFVKKCCINYLEVVAPYLLKIIFNQRKEFNMTIKELPMLLGKQHMLKLGLSEYQYYQCLKDPTLSVQVGKRRFISKIKLIEQLNLRRSTNESKTTK